MKIGEIILAMMCGKMNEKEQKLFDSGFFNE
jgi:hypothetical protein